MLGAVTVTALDNGVARTPPMGWSTWNKLKCNFNEQTLLDVARALNESGMVAAGFKTLNIDDCWPAKQRAPDGSIVPDPQKFPRGMLAFSNDLAQYGLGLGIYTAHGNFTCQSYPGSYGYEEADARAYASWNVRFVKNDWCTCHPGKPAVPDLPAFDALRDALNRTGRNMVYSVHWNYALTKGPTCAKGVSCPLPDVANMWRIGGDIGPHWNSVLRLIDIDTPLAANAGPGHWNDADMLEVGNGMTEDQDRAHMTMWAMLASPLVAGNDVRTMSAATRSILTNAHVIGVNQDALGMQATLVAGTGPDAKRSRTIQEVLAQNGGGASATQVWAKPLMEANAVAVAFLHRNASASAPTSIALEWSAIGAAADAKFEIFDLWADAKSLGVHSKSFSVDVPPSAARMFKFVPKPKPIEG